MNAHKLGLQVWFPVLQEHFYYLLEVPIKFFKGLTLGMGPWKPRYITNVETSIRTSLYNGAKASHVDLGVYCELLQSTVTYSFRQESLLPTSYVASDRPSRFFWHFTTKNAETVGERGDGTSKLCGVSKLPFSFCYAGMQRDEGERQ